MTTEDMSSMINKYTYDKCISPQTKKPRHVCSGSSSRCMLAALITCYPLVNHFEYAPCT